MTAVDFAAFVDRLAQVSGEVILPFFRTAIGAEDKSRGGVFDPVTEADRGAEAAMRRLIAQTFPDHGVIGEEYGRDRPEAEYVWVLDPIDGTKSFISGLPTWGTLIELMHRGQPVYGMMAQPFTRERFYGDGKRAKLRTLAPSRGEAPPSEWTTRALRSRSCGSLREATWQVALAPRYRVIVGIVSRIGGIEDCLPIRSAIAFPGNEHDRRRSHAGACEIHLAATADLDQPRNVRPRTRTLGRPKRSSVRTESAGRKGQ